MKTIHVYHTHIEIYPYKEGECEWLERQLSVWIKQTFTRNKIAYAIYGNKLYIPRGVSIQRLEKEFQTQAITHRESDPYLFMSSVPEPKLQPKNSIQEDCIKFLCGEDKFFRSSMYSQISLNADTGDGKTFCTLYSICKYKMRAIIVTHINKIRNQWIDSALNMFSFDECNIVTITGANMMNNMINCDRVEGDLFFISHKTINVFIEMYGLERLHDFFRKINVGIKVYDEAHLEFKSIIQIDMFSDTMKTIYLTANFDRSDPDENRVFHRAFASVMQFGEETLEYDEKRRHIIYCPTLYSSDCPANTIELLRNGYGFDSRRFIDYALNGDPNESMLKQLKVILDRVNNVEGKILIISPKIASCEELREKIESFNLEKNIGTIHSKNSPQVNETSSECDIIISTIKSVGTGVDIKGLRILINLEPIASSVTTNQLRGRLREYAPDKDTFLFDLIDVSIPRCYEMYKLRCRILKKKCKKIVVFKV